MIDLFAGRIQRVTVSRPMSEFVQKTTDPMFGCHVDSAFFRLTIDPMARCSYRGNRLERRLLELGLNRPQEIRRSALNSRQRRDFQSLRVGYRLFETKALDSQPPHANFIAPRFFITNSLSKKDLKWAELCRENM
jgi:hypothetical protein